MAWHDPRTLLLRALLLDWFGQLLILALILFSSEWLSLPMAASSLFEVNYLWLIFCLLIPFSAGSLAAIPFCDGGVLPFPFYYSVC